MLRTISLGGAALGCVLLAGATSARAQAVPVSTPSVDPIDIPPEHDPLANAWDEPDERGGFYLRAGFGLGFQSDRIGPPPWESDSNGTRARGFATDFHLDVGGALTPRIALHLDSHISALWSGDIRQDFGIAGADPGTARIVAYGAGPGATFFSRRNFFFRVGAGVGFAQTRWPQHDGVTKPGFYLDTTLGKEVFRDDHSAFGFHMQFIYMNLGADDRDEQVRVRALTWGANYAFDGI
jgi:hypothetical protein